MKTAQLIFSNGQWNKTLPAEMNSKNTLCLVFFGPDVALDTAIPDLHQSFPDSIIVGCSGAGEILGDQIQDERVIVTVVKFEISTIKAFSAEISDGQDSQMAGAKLAKMFPTNDLKGLYVICEGLLVNGTKLMEGIISSLPNSVTISGGLAGDGTRFSVTKTLIGNKCRSGQIVGIGFYGNEITVVSSSRGGWMPFGPERKITHSIGNVVYSIDDIPALKLYKDFLGKAAENLPSSGLNFPLFVQVSDDESHPGVVRTILNVDEDKQTMTFAGDIPAGRIARLMRSTHSSLVEAASDCADECKKMVSQSEPVLSLIVSCVGRRLVMGSVTEDEIEVVHQALPNGSAQTGFYSYGEIAPNGKGFCDLHNQTMTITWISEKLAG